MNISTDQRKVWIPIVIQAKNAYKNGLLDLLDVVVTALDFTKRTVGIAVTSTVENLYIFMNRKKVRAPKVTMGLMQLK